jgi:hypothetical protein
LVLNVAGYTSVSTLAWCWCTSCVSTVRLDARSNSLLDPAHQPALPLSCSHMSECHRTKCLSLSRRQSFLDYNRARYGTVSASLGRRPISRRTYILNTGRLLMNISNEEYTTLSCMLMLFRGAHILAKGERGCFFRVTITSISFVSRTGRVITTREYDTRAMRMCNIEKIF